MSRLMIFVRGIKEYTKYQEDKTRTCDRRNYQRVQFLMVELVI